MPSTSSRASRRAARRAARRMSESVNAYITLGQSLNTMTTNLQDALAKVDALEETLRLSDAGRDRDNDEAKQCSSELLEIKLWEERLYERWQNCSQECEDWRCAYFVQTASLEQEMKEKAGLQAKYDLAVLQLSRHEE
jgi:hypothetical protein